MGSAVFHIVCHSNFSDLLFQYPERDQLYFILFVILSSVIYYFSIQKFIKVAETYLVQLLQNFINETKYTSNKGVDVILSYILQENKEKHPTMYKVAVHVLRNCSITFNFPIKMVCRLMSVF